MAKAWQFAGIRVKIQHLYDYFDEFALGYELPEGESVEEEIEIKPHDIEYERERSAATDRAEGRAPVSYSDPYLETLAIYRKFCEKAILHDVLLFHASAIAVDGKAYLFAAPSGTGKSTHVSLWRECFGDRAVMINDDKPLLRMTKEGVFACGTPWNGKHRLGSNISAAVAGICLLKRGEINQIKRLRGVDALPGLMAQIFMPEGEAGRQRMMELTFQLAKTVPFFQLSCNMEKEAAMVAFEGMNGGL